MSKHPVAQAMAREKAVAIEVNPISNQVGENLSQAKFKKYHVVKSHKRLAHCCDGTSLSHSV